MRSQGHPRGCLFCYAKLFFYRCSVWENRGANETEGDQGQCADWLDFSKKSMIDDRKTILTSRYIDEQLF